MQKKPNQFKKKVTNNQKNLYKMQYQKLKNKSKNYKKNNKRDYVANKNFRYTKKVLILDKIHSNLYLQVITLRMSLMLKLTLWILIKRNPNLT